MDKETLKLMIKLEGIPKDVVKASVQAVGQCGIELKFCKDPSQEDLDIMAQHLFLEGYKYAKERE